MKALSVSSAARPDAAVAKSRGHAVDVKTQRFPSLAPPAFSSAFRDLVTSKSSILCALCVLCGPPPGARADSEDRALAALQTGGSPQDKDAACLRLRLTATAKSIPALAALLPDEQLSHAARLVLEGMSDPAAGAAMVAALDQTAGPLRIGIVNSIGVRAEAAAAPRLIALLADPDVATASAAAGALGRIGGDDALRALADAPAAIRGSAVTARLAGAHRLLASGRTDAAAAVFASLDTAQSADFVRTAAFRGRVLASGDQAGGLLTAAIQSNDRARQMAALQLFHELPGDKVTRAACDLLPGAAPALRTALLEALAGRGDAAAAGAIVPYARDADAAVRQAAIGALGLLGDAAVAPALAGIAGGGDAATQKAARQALLRLNGGDVTTALLAALPEASPGVAVEIVRAIGGRGGGDAIGPLVRVLETAPDEATIDAARDAIIQTCVHARHPPDPGPLFAALQHRRDAVRLAVLQILSGLADPGVRAALRAAAQDADPGRRVAAQRAVCATRDPALLPDLLALARDGGDETLRVLAIRGAVRLVTQAPGGLPPKDQAGALGTLLGLATRTEERLLVVGSLAAVPGAESLALAKSLENSPGLEAEAKRAAEQIEDALSQRTFRDGYVLAWQVAGPFEEKGRSHDALFDAVFPPEKPDAGDVAWRALPAGTDPQRPWLLDLLKALGGEQRVAYVRTRIHSTASLPVRLEAGSDDGNKIWLNGVLVHAKNVARPLTPGSDRVDVTLNEGWNTLLLKITQNNLGWEFCVRLVRPDGQPIRGLQVSAAP